MSCAVKLCLLYIMNLFNINRSAFVGPVKPMSIDGDGQHGFFENQFS